VSERRIVRTTMDLFDDSVDSLWSANWPNDGAIELVQLDLDLSTGWD
jgi:hypothetical protein